MPALSRTGAAAKQYKARVDFTESVGGRSGSGSAEAEIAVVGGAARANGQNDFAGANVKGKIALVTGPGMPGGGSAVENAYAEGAAGVLVIGGATIRYSPIPRLQSATIPTLVITEDVANDLLAASGKKVSDEQAAVNARRADPNAPDSGFDVPTVVRMSVSLTPVHDVDAFNVVGLLRAPDPDAAKRAVMVGGHLDGVGTDPDGSVFQAANDNASGPAVVIEMARALSAAKASLRHSVLFVAFAGEEEGLLGSEAYAAQTSDQMKRAGTRQTDVCATPGGEIASGRHEAVARDQLERRVDRQGLDDAVQVERKARRPREQPPRQPDAPPAAGSRLAERPVVRQLCEVPV